MKRLAFFLVVLLLGSCTPIATVKPTIPRYVARGNQEPALAAAENRLQDAANLKTSNPLQALGDYLASAQAAFDRLKQHPDDQQARNLYNFAVARSVEVIEAGRLNPWDGALKVPSPEGEYTVTNVRPSGPEYNPGNYELIPGDTIVLGGTYLDRRVTVDGIGATTVVVSRQEQKGFRKTFGTRLTYANATALIRFNDHRAQIEFLLTLQTERVSLGGHEYRLAADFPAAGFLGLARERPDKLGFARMVRPDKFADTARLTRLQMYDPNSIPVIFVHGLQDTPASWAPMINAMYEDPDIRRHYQFWVFSYPSGYPYPYSAALFREELDGAAKAFPGHKKFVLVGHSMGGIISRLMITDVGDKVWRDFFGKSPAETNISGADRSLLEESLIFHHRTDVSRVVYICAPHRGAPMGANWIGKIGTSLVRMPFLVAAVPFRAISAAMVHDPSAEKLNRIPTSIDTLSPKNRFVVEIEKYPTTPGIPYHTIEGDRGRGDAPNSSDGVVPYWSSHFGGETSELIVPSNHSAPRNPQAIAEVGRILKLNAHITE